MSILHSLLSVILLITLTATNPGVKNIRDSEKNGLSLVKSDSINYRLPKYVVPTGYIITLESNLENFTFAGESHINITVDGTSVREIIVHAKDLDFDKEFTYLDYGKTILNAKTVAHDKETDFLKLLFGRLIVPGNYTLHLKYTGVLNEDSNGFYRTSYMNKQNEKVWLAATNFKPTQARRAFPCFDEPSMKAKFSIAIKHSEKYTAVSNMPVIGSTRIDNSKWLTKFQVTPDMSTYQIAFVISDLKPLVKPVGTLKIWGKRDNRLLGIYALITGTRELKHLENITGIKNVIPKIDIFCIPQLNTNAIEGWGIVTFRDIALLDEHDTSTVRKQSIATLMSQKLANQWFGNLVGPSWWDYTWLSEGFANYFQYYVTDKIEPTWRLMEQFVIKNMQETAFVVDDNKTQHPMNNKVENTQDIVANFDSISQSKAGCVIRMIAHALGDTVFKSGLQRYLKNKQFSVASSTDLFNELVEVAEHIPKNISLKKVLDSWADQSGYPVITALRDYTNGSLTLSQNRYLSDKNSGEQFTENWWIPVNNATQDNPNFNDTLPSFWMEPFKRTNLTVNNLHAKQWIIFNNKQTGYYRVNYDETNWQLISDYLGTENYTKIDVLNRAQLLDDSFNLVKTGDLKNYSIFLHLSSYLEKEIDYVPWYAAFRAFAVLDKALGMDDYKLFKLYILKLVEKLEKAVGYSEKPDGDHLTKLNRINVIEWACKAGSESCKNVTHERLVQHLNGKNKIGVDHLSVVLCAGIRTANATTWNKTFKIYEWSKDSSERSVILKALGCSLDADILQSYLAKTLDMKLKIPRKDVIKAVYEGSETGINVAFKFIIENYKVLTNGNNATFLSCLYDIGSRITTTAQVEKVEKFINVLSDEKKDLADALRDIALVSAKKNIEWTIKHGTTIWNFLQEQHSEYSPNPSPATPSPATPSPATPSPATTSRATPSPATPSSATPSPATQSPETPSPATPSSATTSPATPSPATPSPATPSSATRSPAIPSPETPSPETPSPATPSPATLSSATPSPATISPATQSPATPSPATPSPATPSPATPSPANPSPATPSPATPSPATSSPATPSSATPSSATPSPATPSSATTSPATPSHATPSPETPSPETPSPETPSPATPSPATPSPATPSPATPSPATPSPATPSPVTSSPATPSPETPSPDNPYPATPSPATPSPATPSLATPSPATPYPETLSPVTPSPATPSPATPSPATPSPATPYPETPSPATPSPATPSPATPTPATPPPPTPSPATSSPTAPPGTSSSPTAPTTTASSGTSSPNLSNHSILLAMLSVIVARFISTTK